ncbi:MAG: mechanosensitive ion channel family protein [Desulfobacterales bacterium]|nr:mechanosensitive ion channel family protein [Desulfobacterales bacterium]
MPKGKTGDKVPLVKIVLYFGLSIILFLVYSSWPAPIKGLGLVFSPERNLLFYQVFGVFFWLAFARTVTLFLKRYVWHGWLRRRMATMPPKLLVDLTSAVVWLAVLFIIASFVFGWEITGVLTASGVMMAVIGFALKNLISDIFTGIVLGFEGFVKNGDWIEIKGEDPGEVLEINWRTTKLRTERGIVVIVPNSELATKNFRNYHMPETHFRESFKITLGYNVTSHQAERILLSAISQIPESISIPEKPSVRVTDYTERGVEWEVRFWVPDYPSRTLIRYRVNRNVMRNLHFSGSHVPRRRFELLDIQTPQPQDGFAKDIDFLKGVEILSCLEDKEITTLLGGLKRSVAKAGVPVVRRNDKGTSLFIIKEGVLNVYVRTGGSADIQVGQLISGSFFGEMSLLTGAARSATVTPEVDSLLFEITKEQIEPLLESNPVLVERLSAVLADRQMINLRAMENSAQEDLKKNRSNLVREFMGRIQRFFNIEVPKRTK